MGVFIKEWAYQEWNDFKDPVLFRCLFVKQQVEAGLITPSALNSALMKKKLNRNPVWLRMCMEYRLWLEICLLLC
jgi:hypothetical protein